MKNDIIYKYNKNNIIVKDNDYMLYKKIHISISIVNYLSHYII